VAAMMRANQRKERGVAKRSIILSNHKTSVSLEIEFWNAVKEIAAERDISVNSLIGQIDSNRNQNNLSSAIRLFVLEYYQSRIRT
jgi:predicted DNA-binding ribbon-helix-helix protein